MPLSVALMVLASFTALPEGMSARVTLEPAVIPFHHPAQYTVSVEVPVGTAVQMPSMMGRFDGLTAVPGEQHEEILDNNRVRISETYAVEAIFPGHYTIEPATLTIDGKEYAVPSPVLTVRELTEDEQAAAEEFDAALPDFDPAIAAPFWLRWWFWALLAGAGILGGLIGFMLRRRALGELGPEKTPWEIALARLDALRSRGLAEKGEFDRYYVDLSAILRYYIEARFDLHAPERTTEEFLKEMADAKVFDDRQEAFLGSFLKHCDYVKFARLQPELTETNQRFEQVVEFVKETVPAEPAEEPEAA